MRHFTCAVNKAIAHGGNEGVRHYSLASSLLLAKGLSLQCREPSSQWIRFTHGILYENLVTFDTSRDKPSPHPTIYSTRYLTFPIPCRAEKREYHAYRPALRHRRQRHTIEICGCETCIWLVTTSVEGSVMPKVYSMRGGSSSWTGMDSKGGGDLPLGCTPACTVVVMSASPTSFFVPLKAGVSRSACVGYVGSKASLPF